MKQLIMIENRKFFKNKKNKLIILIILSLIISYPFINSIKREGYYKDITMKMRNEKNASSSLYALLSGAKDNKEEIDEEKLLYLNEEMKRSLILEHYYKQKDFSDWKRVLGTYNDKYKNIIYGYENNYISEDILLVRNQEIPTIKGLMFLNNYLIENDIEYEPNPYETNGRNFLLYGIENINSIILLILLILLSIDAFYSELEGDTYKMYYTQPYERASFFKSKIYRGVVLPMVVYSMLLLFGFIVISIIFGIGDLDYPRIIVSKNILFNLIPNPGIIEEFQLISSFKFILLNYMLLLVGMVFFALLSNIIVLFTDSLRTSLGVIISLLIFHNMKDNFISNSSKIRFYLPTEYISTTKVLVGNTNTSYLVGLVVLIILIIIMIIIGFYKFRSKDLVGGRD